MPFNIFASFIGAGVPSPRVCAITVDLLVWFCGAYIGMMYADDVCHRHARLQRRHSSQMRDGEPRCSKRRYDTMLGFASTGRNRCREREESVLQDSHLADGHANTQRSHGHQHTRLRRWHSRVHCLPRLQREIDYTVKDSNHREARSFSKRGRLGFADVIFFWERKRRCNVRKSEAIAREIAREAFDGSPSLKVH